MEKAKKFSRYISLHLVHSGVFYIICKFVPISSYYGHLDIKRRNICFCFKSKIFSSKLVNESACKENNVWTEARAIFSINDNTFEYVSKWQNTELVFQPVAVTPLLRAQEKYM